MAGNIIGDPIKKVVSDQINLRQKLQGAGYNGKSIERTPEVLNFLNNKNAWIKLASGVALKNTTRLKDLAQLETEDYFTEDDQNSLSGIELAKNYILFNTIQSLEEGATREKVGEGNSNQIVQTTNATYISRSGVRNTNTWKGSNNKTYGGMGGSSRGLQPVPGITGIKVESINRGSIRKAVVTLKAYNKFQFGIIEILYLRLGYLMMLEWGWDKYIDSIDDNNKPVFKQVESTIIENDWFKSGKSFTQLEMLKNINGFVDTYKGNYQGFFGKVNNFTWKLNKDNTYDITINLITIGAVIESISVIVPSPPISSQQLKLRKTKLETLYKINQAPKEGEESSTDVESNSVIGNLGTDLLSTFLAQQIESFFDAGLQNSKDYCYLPNTIGAYSAGNAQNDANINRSKVPPSSRFYIRFGELIEKIENNVILRVANGNSRTSPTIEFERSEKFTRISYEPNLIPLDPSICIFKPIYTDDIGVVGNVNLPTFSSLKDFVKEKDGVYHGELMNVYLNMDFISKTLSSNKDKKGNVTLFDFLQKLLDGINKCMGNVCELTTCIKNDNIIYFLDENPIQGYDQVYPKINQNPAVFNIVGYNSDGTSTFVKDFNFQTKITPSLMNQISMGAAAPGSPTNSVDAIGFLNWNSGLKNRFEETYKQGPTDNFLPPALPTTEQAAIDEAAYFKESFDKFKSDVGGRPTSGYVANKGYKWTYKGYTMYLATEETSYWSFNSTNWADPAFQELFKKQVKEIDASVAQINTSNQTTFADSAGNAKDGYNDYPTYLLDAFGGTGTRKILVKTKDLYKTVTTREKIGSEGGKPIYANIRKKVLKNPNTAVATDIPVVEGAQTGLGGESTFVMQQVGTSDALYWYTSDNPDFMERGYNMFKKYKNSIDKNNFEVASQVGGSTGFIPVTLGFTFDGIGGINIYNSLSVNQKALPSTYPAFLNFLVDGVDHEVKSNIWETSLTTISTPRTTKGDIRKIVKPKEIFVKGETLSSNVVVNPWTGDEKFAKTLTNGYSLRAQSNNGLMYYPIKTPKIQFVVHHTAGLGGAKAIIENSWSKKSTHVSTHFIIDRAGRIEQLFPLDFWGNHIGSKRAGNSYLQKSTVSVELVALGYVKVKGTSRSNSTFNKDSVFIQSDRSYTYEKLQQGQSDVPVAQPYYMDSSNKLKPWGDYKGYGLFHSYTKKQLKSLEKVMKQVKTKFPNITFGSKYSGGNGFYEQFPKKGGGVASTAFSKNRGTFTHNSYRTDKSDVFPQKELLQLFQKFNK